MESCETPKCNQQSTDRSESFETETSLTDESDENLELGLPNDVVYRQTTSDVNSSICFAGKRILRQYASEFVLPDDTRVAVSRKEVSRPCDGDEEVIMSLAIAIELNEKQIEELKSISSSRQNVQGNFFNTSVTSSEGVFSGSSFDTDSDAKNGVENGGISDTKHVPTNSTSLHRPHRHCPRGLQIADYMQDDPWAATILIADSSVSVDLLRQLECGCRLEPEMYRMERVQRKRNWETIIDVQNQPTIRSIALSRSQSETDSIGTACTNVGD